MERKCKLEHSMEVVGRSRGASKVLKEVVERKCRLGHTMEGPLGGGEVLIP